MSLKLRWKSLLKRILRRWKKLKTKMILKKNPAKILKRYRKTRQKKNQQKNLVKKKRNRSNLRKRLVKNLQKKRKRLKKNQKKLQKEQIYALRTTANREDQVMDFVGSNAAKKKLEVYTIIRPHGMRGYIFLEAATKSDAEQAAFGVPYARGILPKEIDFSEIEHMLEQGKKEVNIQKNDICEIISGPFKREKAKITRIDKQKEEVVVELLEAAVPIPITVKMDSVKVIRRDNPQEEE